MRALACSWLADLYRFQARIRWRVYFSIIIIFIIIGAKGIPYPQISKAGLVMSPSNISIFNETVYKGNIPKGSSYSRSIEECAELFNSFITSPEDIRTLTDNIFIYRVIGRDVGGFSGSISNYLNIEKLLVHNCWRPTVILNYIFKLDSIFFGAKSYVSKQASQGGSNNSFCSHFPYEHIGALDMSGRNLRKASTLFSGTSGIYGGLSTSDRKSQRNEQNKTPYCGQDCLPSIEYDGIFRSLRHSPLLAQIGLIVILGLLAFGVGPIGIVLLLFPLNPKSKDRPTAWFLSGLGFLSFGLIICFVFLG